MHIRPVLAAALLVATAFGTAACGPKSSGGDTAVRTPPATVATQPTASTPSASDAATPTTEGTDTPSADPGDEDCKQPTVPAGHKVVYLAKASTATTVSASDTKWRCNPDTDYYAVGSAKSYTFAAGAKAELHHENVRKSVTLAQLATHTAKCLSHQTDPAAPCSGPAYDIVLDSAGKISQITEVWF